MNFHDWLFEREIKQIILETGINELELENQLLSEVAWVAPMVAGKLIDKVIDRRFEERDQESWLQKFYKVFIKAVKTVGIVAAIAAAFYLGMNIETLRKMLPSLPDFSKLIESILGRGKDFLKMAADKVIQYIPEFATILKSVAGFEVARRVVQGAADKVVGKTKEAGGEAAKDIVQRGKETIKQKAKETINKTSELPLPTKPRELPNPRRGIDSIAGRDILRQAKDIGKTLTQPFPKIKDKPLPTPVAGDQSWYDYLSGSTKRAAERASDAIRNRIRKAIPGMPDILPRPGDWIPRARF